MTQQDFLEKVEANPIIAAVRNDEGLSKALASDVNIIFILYGDICSISDITERIEASGKISMVHMDLISGLNHSSEASVEFIKKFTKAAGIITTKGNLIGKAQELDLRTVLRYFILDSKALDLIGKQSRAGCVQPDLIEILPGAVRSIVIERIRKIVRVPVICGGLISSKEEVVYALKSGALAISATNEAVWKL